MRGSHYIEAMASSGRPATDSVWVASPIRWSMVLLLVASTACGPSTPPLVPVDAGPPPLPPPECDTIAPVECPDPELTYADVEPIMLARCVDCHDGRGVEWPLTTYSHVADWQTDIRSRMLDCTMPPPESGLPMANEERQLIVDWIRCGLPR